MQGRQYSGRWKSLCVELASYVDQGTVHTFCSYLINIDL